MYRKVDLDNATLNRSNNTLIKTLQGGKHLTRLSIKSALEKANIPAEGLRLGYILMHAELDGIICSGPRQGKQFTYALLEERVPPAKTLEKEEALAELANRYFTSRGPATINDFVWWSGLTVKEAREAIAMLPPHFVQEKINGQDYLFAPQVLNHLKKYNTAFLLPDYDEYGISYKDRSAIFTHNNTGGGLDGKPVSDHVIVIDGKIAGTWKQTIKNNRNANSVIVETSPFTILNKTKQQALLQAVKRYTSFSMEVN